MIKIKIENQTCGQLDIRLFLCTLFLIVATLQTVNYQRLIFFIFSGIFLGWFYGENNNEIWSNEQDPDHPRKKENIHNHWVHIVGGVTGGISLYFLLSHINFGDPLDLFDKAGSIDFVLFIIAILGFTGYIPRVLWLVATTGKLLEKLIKS